MLGNICMYNDLYNNIFDKLDSYIIPFIVSTMILFVILPPLYIDFSLFFLWSLRFLVFWVLIWISGIGISPVGCITWIFIWRYDILLSWNKYDNLLCYHQTKCKVISRLWITSSYRLCDQQISTWSWICRHQKEKKTTMY
jgi:hypothetical protein